MGRERATTPWLCRPQPPTANPQPQTHNLDPPSRSRSQHQEIALFYLEEHALIPILPPSPPPPHSRAPCARARDVARRVAARAAALRAAGLRRAHAGLVDD